MIKLAVVSTNYPNEMPKVFRSLESAILNCEENGFEITSNINTQSDLSRGGVRMERRFPLAETEVVQIVLVDVQ